MDPQSLKKINAARINCQTVMLLTEIGIESGGSSRGGFSGRDRVIYPSDKLSGEMGRAIDKAFLSGKSGVAIINGSEFFLNVYLPQTAPSC